MANSGVVFTEPKFTPSEHSASKAGKIVEPNLYGIGTNYATANKWIAFLPLENVLGPRYKNVDLHFLILVLMNKVEMIDTIPVCPHISSIHQHGCII